jgi:hypothetical protein
LGAKKEHDGAMRSLLEPSAGVHDRSLALWVLLLLLLSAISVLAAALAMPAAYSWRVHSISESAAQGLQNAWIARLAFICFGSAVFVLSLAMRKTWARTAYWMHLVFAGSMFGTAAFSHKPWMPGVPIDQFEDLLHSVTATGMGFAFCIGVIARFAQRGRNELLRRALDLLALILATVMPIVLATSSTDGGLVQRAMFVVAYVWYGAEALSLRSSQPSST